MMTNVKSGLTRFSWTAMMPWFICGLAALFYCYEYLLRIVPSAMESELMAAFGISTAGLGLLSSYFFFAYTPLQLPVGLMMDKFGPRRILTMAIFCCAIGITLMASTHILGIALLGRFLIGFGAAFAFVGVLKLASIWLPPERFAFIAGMTTSLGMIGAMLGQNFLTQFVDAVGMEQTMLYSSVIGFCLLPIIWFSVRDKPKGEESPMENFESYSSFFKEILHVFGNKQIWFIGLTGALIMLPTTVFAELWGRLFFKTYYHFNSKLAAQATSMIFLGWAVGGPLAGFISDTIKNRRLLLFIGSFLGSVIMLTLIYGPLLPLNALFVLLFLFGVVSSVEIICFAVARENSPTALAGTAVAMTNFIVVCAGPFQWLVGKMLDLSRGSVVDSAGFPIYSVQDFQFALFLLPASMLMGFVLCFFIKETHCQAKEEQ